MFEQIALIAAGSNEASVHGGAAATVAQALTRVAALASGPVTVSPLYASPAFPAHTGPDFVNAAIAISTSHSATDLLAALHSIEAMAGRTRTLRWGQRTLDLDLIALGDLVMPDRDVQTAWRNLAPDQQSVSTPDQLILPHPRLQDRAFVLVPLADVAADWEHPLLQISVAQMLDRLPMSDRAGIVALVNQGPSG